MKPRKRVPDITSRLEAAFGDPHDWPEKLQQENRAGHFADLDDDDDELTAGAFIGDWLAERPETIAGLAPLPCRVRVVALPDGGWSVACPCGAGELRVEREGDAVAWAELHAPDAVVYA